MGKGVLGLDRGFVRLWQLIVSGLCWIVCRNWQSRLQFIVMNMRNTGMCIFDVTRFTDLSCGFACSRVSLD
jgi:hypothetical protein